VALGVSLLAHSQLRHHMFDLDCHRRNGTANFGCSAGTPAPGTAADRSGTSTRSWSATLLVELPGIEPVLDLRKCGLTCTYATCGSRWLREIPGASAGDVGGANTRTRRTTQAKLVCEKRLRSKV